MPQTLTGPKATEDALARTLDAVDAELRSIEVQQTALAVRAGELREQRQHIQAASDAAKRATLSSDLDGARATAARRAGPRERRVVDSAPAESRTAAVVRVLTEAAAPLKPKDIAERLVAEGRPENPRQISGVLSAAAKRNKVKLVDDGWVAVT